MEYKQSLKQYLRPLGFRGYQYTELTPNLTRRAQCTNWLLYYREVLFGYTIEELQEQRRIRQIQQEQMEKVQNEQREQNETAIDDDNSETTISSTTNTTTNKEDNWQPPVQQIY